MQQPLISRRLFSRSDLIRLIVPLILEQALSIIVGVVDTIMVAGLGEDAVSGVSMMDSVMALILLVFAAFGAGGAVVAGQYMGSGRDDLGRETGRQLLFFSAAVSLVLLILCYAGLRQVLGLVYGGVTESVQYHADRYLLVVLLSIPGLALYNAGTALFRTMGMAGITLWISLLMNGLNVAGNALFIFVLHMGTGGAALATVLARYAAVLALLLLLRRKDLPLRLEGGLCWKPDLPLIRRILRIAVPGGVENGMFQLGKILFVGLYVGLGSAALAANSISHGIAGVQLIPGLAIQLAATAVIARCMGAGDIPQVKYYNRLLNLLSYLTLLAMSLIIWLALPAILNWYHLSPDTAAIARQLMGVHTLGAIILWTPSFVLPCSLRAAGDVTFTMAVAVFTMWVFRIGLSWVLVNYTAIGPVGPWICMQIDWIFRTAAYLWRWLQGRWQSMKVI